MEPWFGQNPPSWVLTTKKDIISFLKKNRYPKYRILPDLMVDVMGNLMFNDNIPIKLRFVRGQFSIGGSITNLDNCPIYINGNFYVNFTSIKTLKGGPKIVTNLYDCSNNKNLYLLSGAPYKVRKFLCQNCNLETLRGSPKIVKGEFNCSHNRLVSLKYGPNKVKSYNCMLNPKLKLDGFKTEIETYFKVDNYLKDSFEFKKFLLKKQIKDMV